MPHGRGTKACTFECDEAETHRCVETLARYGFVDAAITYSDGRLRYRIDLAALPEGDGPCAERMVRVELEKTIGRHRVPTLPPTKDAA